MGEQEEHVIGQYNNNSAQYSYGGDINVHQSVALSFTGELTYSL